MDSMNEDMARRKEKRLVRSLKRQSLARSRAQHMCDEVGTLVDLCLELRSHLERHIHRITGQVPSAALATHKWQIGPTFIVNDESDGALFSGTEWAREVVRERISQETAFGLIRDRTRYAQAALHALEALLRAVYYLDSRLASLDQEELGRRGCLAAMDYEDTLGKMLNAADGIKEVWLQRLSKNFEQTEDDHRSCEEEVDCIPTCPSHERWTAMDISEQIRYIHGKWKEVMAQDLHSPFFEKQNFHHGVRHIIKSHSRVVHDKFLGADVETIKCACQRLIDHTEGFTERSKKAFKEADQAAHEEALMILDNPKPE